MTERGIVLWVRVRTPEREEMAQKILSEHGDRAIRVHKIEIDKTVEDIPLSKLRPDPWLGNERLGDLRVHRAPRRKKSEFLMVIMAAATPPTEDSRYVQPVEADDRSQRPFIQ